jgi:hypothetical protein
MQESLRKIRFIIFMVLETGCMPHHEEASWWPEAESRNAERPKGQRLYWVSMGKARQSRVNN